VKWWFPARFFRVRHKNTFYEGLTWDEIREWKAELRSSSALPTPGARRISTKAMWLSLVETQTQGADSSSIASNASRRPVSASLALCLAWGFLKRRKESCARRVQIGGAFWSAHDVIVRAQSDETLLQICFVPAMQSEATVLGGSRRVVA
jgi:hypothetical protein